MIRAADNVFFDINSGSITILNNNIPQVSLSQNQFEIEMEQDTLENRTLEIVNDGEDGSVLNYRSRVGMEFVFHEMFEDGDLPSGWYDTTNATGCENPGWFISEDASSAYFDIPPGDGLYIATNDDACNSDGSNDILYTGQISLPDGMVELSFDRFFRTGFGHTFHLLISSDSWQTSTEIFELGYLDGNESWVRETVNLEDYAGQIVELGMKSDDNGQWASGVALDNISLGVTPSWITTNASGYLNYMDSENLNFSINTSGLELGNHQGSVVIENIQTAEEDTIHIHLTVSESIVGISQEIVPNDFELYQNYPNPFNPETSVRFSLPIQQDVSLAIYDMIGRKVRMMTKKSAEPGHHVIRWNGKNQNGTVVSAGVYFYQLHTPSFSMTKKMILLK
tara:strand:- start:274 stop:1458 length:1185 start_codon:yes stop_codon:yes gene_type:complete